MVYLYKTINNKGMPMHTNANDVKIGRKYKKVPKMKEHHIYRLKKIKKLKQKQARYNKEDKAKFINKLKSFLEFLEDKGSPFLTERERVCCCKGVWRVTIKFVLRENKTIDTKHFWNLMDNEINKFGLRYHRISEKGDHGPLYFYKIKIYEGNWIYSISRFFY